MSLPYRIFFSCKILKNFHLFIFFLFLSDADFSPLDDGKIVGRTALMMMIGNSNLNRRY